MAANFRINTRKINKKKIIIHLSGDFDGSSAWELIHKLKQCSDEYPMIVVNTDKIKTIEPYGQGIFDMNLGGLKKTVPQLVITGEKARSLSDYQLR